MSLNTDFPDLKFYQKNKRQENLEKNLKENQSGLLICLYLLQMQRWREEQVEKSQQKNDKIGIQKDQRRLS